MFMVRIKLLLVVILVSMVRNKSMGAKKKLSRQGGAENKHELY